MTNKEITKIVASEMSKSKKMIELYSNGLEIKEIATLLNVRYNFVYNVISNFCVMNTVELRTNQSEGSNKKQLILELFNQGKSNIEIQKELKISYNYIYKVTSEEIKQTK